MGQHTPQYKPMMAGHPPTQRLKEQDGFITTHLHLAALQGGAEDIKEALSKGVQVDAPDEELQTPLFIAAQVGNIGSLRELLLQGADLDAQNSSGQTPLMAALEAGQLHAAQTLLRQGADPTLPDQQKRTPLHLAAGHPTAGIITIMTSLLDSGGALEARDAWGATPLHFAVKSCAVGSVDVVAWLLQRRAEPMSAAWDQRKPLMLAAQAGDAQKVQLLLTACGKDLRHLRDLQRNTALHLAVEGGHTEVVKMLLGDGVQGVSVEDQGMLGWTPLQMAVRSKNTHMVALLLEAGASAHAKADDGLSPADFAAQRLNQPRFAEVARLLGLSQTRALLHSEQR